MGDGLQAAKSTQHITSRHTGQLSLANPLRTGTMKNVPMKALAKAAHHIIITIYNKKAIYNAHNVSKLNLRRWLLLDG